MSKKSIVAITGLLLASTTFLVVAAEARSLSVQGSAGRGFVASGSASRQPGSTSVTRGIQTNSGAGVSTNRNASWGNGSYSGGATHTLNNGDSFGRSTSVTDNGDGTANYSTTHTGVSGQSTTVSGTVSHQ